MNVNIDVKSNVMTIYFYEQMIFTGVSHWVFCTEETIPRGKIFLQAKVPMGKMLFLYPCLNDK